MNSEPADLNIDVVIDVFPTNPGRKPAVAIYLAEQVVHEQPVGGRRFMTTITLKEVWQKQIAEAAASSEPKPVKS